MSEKSAMPISISAHSVSSSARPKRVFTRRSGVLCGRLAHEPSEVDLRCQRHLETLQQPGAELSLEG